MMSALGNPSLQDAVQAHNAAPDASFDHFIDADLIIDTGSPVLSPATPNVKREGKGKPTPLSSLPSRLSTANVDRHTPSSPGAVNEFLAYTHASGSTVTTPTTSNSSSLHNLNFDFFDAEGNEGNASTEPSVSDAISSPQHDMSDVATASATHFGNTTPTDLTSVTHSFFDVNEMGAINPAMPMMPMHSFQRTVDDMGHQPGHQITHHPAHHQRSLSLREVAPPPGLSAFIAGDTMNSFNFNPNIKLEHGMIQANSFLPEQASPSTLDRGSPTSSAVASSIFDRHSPPQEKKRKLTKGNEKTPSKAKSNAAKANAASGKTSTNEKKPTKSRRRPSSASSKKADEADTLATSGPEIQNNALIENSTPAQQSDTVNSVVAAGDVAMQRAASVESLDVTASSEMDVEEQQDESTRKQKGNRHKRQAPSASQKTESGLPFPVIDTSAKHSTLFVPPDMSGLTKREARLVKNRAAAFLSRQRKREQFEELENKCRSLSRLVWRLWEEGSADAGQSTSPVNPFVNPAAFATLMMEQEGADVKQVFDDVLMLKGGSVAPTEDGQLQGAVAAGAERTNGNASEEAEMIAKRPSLAAQAAEDAARDLAKLRAELEEYKKREAGLQAELNHERSVRMAREFEAEQKAREQRPFRVGGDCSLTMPAATLYGDNEEEDVVKVNTDEQSTGTKRRSGRGATAQRPSRTSQRLQRQQSSTTLEHGSAGNVGSQRKAASAALMMVLFSFAMFGLPGGDVGGNEGRAGSILRPFASADTFPMGRVLGAPVITAQCAGEEDDEEAEAGHHLPPSSHLSSDDLFPTSHSLQDVLHDDDGKSTSAAARRSEVNDPLRSVFNSQAKDQAESIDFSMDYQAFAKDLGNSLDWDMQRGFLVLGTNDEEDGEESSDVHDQNPESNVKQTDRRAKGDEGELQGKSDLKDAPTKITLFVPAPPEKHSNADSETLEDRFYDAPLAADSDVGEADQRELTQAEATRAALQVLRNHRVAREAAAFAASRRFAKQATPSRSPSPSLSAKRKLSSATEEHDNEDDVEGTESDDRIDGGMVVDQNDSAADRIRKTDFYQLEFSLSGAKVRNVAELARLFGSMRGKVTE